MSVISVATLAELKAALATAAANDEADVITLTADITATSGADAVSGTGGLNLIRIAITDGMTLSIVGGGFTVDANHYGRVLEVSSGTVAISNLTLREGAVSASGGESNQIGGSALGGGIYNAGDLTLTNVTVIANVAGGGGGGGGGYYSGGGAGAGGISQDRTYFPTGDGGGGFSGTNNQSYPGAVGSGGSGGAGGIPAGTDLDSAFGGTTHGGRGGAYLYTYGGQGGHAAIGAGSGNPTINGNGFSIGGGGGGSGGDADGLGLGDTTAGRGGAAVGGIYNSGTLTLSGGSVTGNGAAGGGGGATYDTTVATGGDAVGGIYNDGVLRLATGVGAVTDNVGGGGLGGSVADGATAASGASDANFAGLPAIVNQAHGGGVAISGTATQGQTLTVTSTLTDGNGLGTLAYQWKADDVDISGATASTFVLTADQVGDLITVTASYTDDDGFADSAVSTATGAVAAPADPNSSVATLAELKAAIAAAAIDGVANTITLTANIEATDSSDFTSGAGGWNLLEINVTDAHTLSIVGNNNTLDANYLGRVILVSGGTVSISNLTVREGAIAADGGAASQAGGDALGAGIYNAGNLTLTNMLVTANVAAAGGGGGGGFYSGGGGGGGGGYSDNFGGAGPLAGAGGASGLGGGNNSAAPGAAGSPPYGGAGGAQAGYAVTSGLGGGASGNTASIDGAVGGLGGFASLTADLATFAGGGGAGSGLGPGATANMTPGAGGAAVAGIYNTGTLSISSMGIGGNVAAGGGGGATYSVDQGGAGGMAVGGLLNVGVLTNVGVSISGNAAVGGAGGFMVLTPLDGASHDDLWDATVNHAHTGGMAITGTATQGQTLTAVSTLADADGLGTLSYQWKAGGADISGATASTFVLTQAQVGAAITVTASYTDGGDTDESATSSATGAVANINDAHTGGMAITGTATQGQTLTAVSTLADADGLGTLSYQWKAGGEDISGATASTFVLTQAQVGAAITVTASYTDDGDTDESATSAATTAVANINDAPTGSLSITGAAAQGQTLTAVSTLADADGLGTLSYQWKAGGADISGATASTFVLTQAQVGAAITVTASYTDGGDTDESATSSPTAAVAAPGAPTTSVGSLADLKSAIAAAAVDGIANRITLTADIAATGVMDFVSGTGGSNLLTIAVTDGQTLSIVGGGHILDANYFGRVLEVSSGTVVISNLTIREGAVTGQGGDYTQAGGSALGGGVYNAGTLSLVNVTVTANAASGGGGGGGGYYIGGGGGGGGPGDMAGAGGAGHDVGNPNGSRPGAQASGGTGGYGGAASGFGETGGYGGSSVGGAGGAYGITFGGTGGSAALGGVSIGGGGGGSGGSSNGLATLGAGGAAVGGIYNTGSLNLTGGLVSGNVAAGGGGGGNDSDDSGAAGGVAVGGLQSTGTLALLNASVTGNVASGGHAGGAGPSVGGPAAAADNNSASALNHAHTGGVTVSGLTNQGQILTAANTLGDADGMGTVNYQWKAGGIDIGGATASTFVLTQAEVGQVVTVVGSYTDRLGFAESATSAGTAVIAVPPPPNTSVSTLAELKTALVAASVDGVANVITFTGDISATGSGDFVTGTGGRDLIKIAVTDGATLSIVGGGFTLDANYWGRALEVSSGTVDISDLTIREGAVAGDGGDYGQAGDAALGAGIYNAGTLTLTGVTVTANSASGGGGGGGGNYSGGGGGGGGPGLMAGAGGSGQTVSGSAGGSAVGGRGGAGGVEEGYPGSGLGGSTTGGGGGDYEDASAGAGGTAALGGLSVGGGGGGAGGGGGVFNVGAGGAAVGGIYNTGTLTLSGGAVSGNIAAGGGGGANDTSSSGAMGGAATGGLLSTGTLVINNNASLTGNIASGGLAASIVGEPVIADGASTNNMQNYAPTGGVTISGTATQGQTLTAANTLADANGLGAISYQWLAGGVAISGATASTFVLTPAQVGAVITVAASYTDAAGAAETAASTGTAAVAAVTAPPTDPTPTTPPPTTSTGTVDGATVSTTTTTASDGSQTQTVVVAPVTGGGPDATADIPVVSSGGVSLLTVGLPAGTGVSAEGPVAPASASAAAPLLSNAIQGASGMSGEPQMEAGAAAYLQTQTGQVLVQTLTLSGANPATPIAIDGSALASGPSTALVIDTRDLPGQTLVTLDNVDFAAIIGEVRLTGGAGDQTVFGDGAAQQMYLGVGDDAVNGGGGADLLHGNLGDDVVHGNVGDDLVYGGQGADVVYGGKGEDQVFGDVGDDLVFGDLGNDTGSGGTGDDLVHGNAGDDVVQGGHGNDLVYGGQGQDSVDGGEGDDRLWGDLGDDILWGDLGADTMTGGLGADTFVFGQGGGSDRIEDFLQSQGDQVQLSGDHGAYTTAQVGADTVLAFTDGSSLVLANVQLASLSSGWITG